jgi:transcription-repair coupling factor (superfamily II helicase)
MSFTAETKTELSRLRDELKKKTRVLSLGGLTSTAAQAFVLSQLQSEIEKTFVVVTATNKDSETFECDLEFWSSQPPKSKIQNPKSKIQTLPSFESDIYANLSPHAETQEKRALALWNLTFQMPDFLVLSAKSLITKTLAPAEIKKLGAILKRDEDFPPEDLIEKLVASGYVREEPIKNIGEFSVRGGILDVWSPTMDLPVRIEFFGDTVDSIREFDAETQLSVGHLKEISIAPMREFAATAKDFRNWAIAARERFFDEKFARALLDRTQFADEGEDFPGWEFLFPIVRERNSSVFDFLPDCVFVIDEPPIVENSLAQLYDNLENHFAEITETGEIGLKPEEIFLNGADLREKLSEKQRLEFRILGKSAAQTGENLEFENENPEIQIGKGKSEIKPLFLKLGALFRISAILSPAITSFTSTTASVNSKASRPSPRKAPNASSCSSSTPTTPSCSYRWSASIWYRDIPRVKRPQPIARPTRRDRLAKDKGKSEAGDARHGRRALKLYAERKLVSGFAFSPDAPWQHEFEDSFPYDLTSIRPPPSRTSNPTWKRPVPWTAWSSATSVTVRPRSRCVPPSRP